MTKSPLALAAILASLCLPAHAETYPVQPQKSPPAQPAQHAAPAAPFFFADFRDDIMAHLATHADFDVMDELAKADSVRATLSEPDIGDLARGQRQPYIANIQSTDRFGDSILTSTRSPLNIQRYINERRQKIERLERKGQRVWSIRLVPLDLPGQPATIQEIE